MTFAPWFSPDGQKWRALSAMGNEYLHNDLRTRETRRLTSSLPLIPLRLRARWRANRFRVRRMAQQIYIMESDGTNVRRISYGEADMQHPSGSARRSDRLCQNLYGQPSV